VPDRFDHIADLGSILDTKAFAAAIAALPDDPVALKHEATVLLRDTLTGGRRKVACRLRARPGSGLEAANAQAWLVDRLVVAIFDLVTVRLLPGSGDGLTLMAVGGYGRGEMAPYSDVDLGFLTLDPLPPRAPAAIEAMLYLLWDLGLKVGQSTRTPDQMIAEARADVTVRTALLESRYLAGDRRLYDRAGERFRAEVQRGTERRFIADKLAERDGRHHRMGDTRYLVEPNVKEGKGALRDLQTLFWIGKYVHDVGRAAQLVPAGLFSPQEYRLFHRADDFLWAVRCHLHDLTGRGEDRLTFDVQREVAMRMRFRDSPGKSAVERFMRLYFLHAKSVGALTGVFLSHLEERFGPRGWRLGWSAIRRAPSRLNGFTRVRGRLGIPRDGFFQEEPVRLLQLFQLADLHRMEIHPAAARAAARDARLVEQVRDDPRANALFLDVLASPRDPELVLRWMNEAGVFGRFVPDFGRVVAMMQFDMYHHYTVDEHTIRAIGLLSRIEKGEFRDDHPLASALFAQIASRRALYAAVLCHDIAKGRGGDHSVLGAEVAEQLCPRLGLTPAETETVSWLVRHHLAMSATAFKRDLSDFKTILDFAGAVQSPERLRLLLILTVVDIRAVGPGVWNSWKRQLLTELYEAAEEVLRLGHKQRGRTERIAAKQAGLAAHLGWDEQAMAAHVRRLPEAYWVAEPDDVLAHNARMIRDAEHAPLAIDAQVYPERGATLVTVYAADHPGLFYRIAGGIHLAGGSVIDARIHTTRDGMALDNFLVQDPFGRPFAEPAQIGRLKRSVEDALANRGRMNDRLIAKPASRPRADAFPIAPNVLISNEASNRFTVVEVNARDRPALLNQLALALFQSKVTIHSAHVATYGERAVDTFYLTDLTGDRITAAARVKALERRLLTAAAGETVELAA